MTAQRFFFCKHCGNIIAFVHASGAPVTCCGDVMQEILPNTTDASQEKHVPVIEVKGSVVTVTVGSVAHPMSSSNLSLNARHAPSSAPHQPGAPGQCLPFTSKCRTTCFLPSGAANLNWVVTLPS